MGEGPVKVRAKHRRARYYVAVGAAVLVGAGTAIGTTVTGASASPNTVASVQVPATSAPSSWVVAPKTATPIQHLVVLFDENQSFDHYFGTYPYATNTDGSTFKAKPGTPKVNGLYSSITAKGPKGPLLTNNPNAYNPQRLASTQALTCSQPISATTSGISTTTSGISATISGISAATSGISLDTETDWKLLSLTSRVGFPPIAKNLNSCT